MLTGSATYIFRNDRLGQGVLGFVCLFLGTGLLGLTAAQLLIKCRWPDGFWSIAPDAILSRWVWFTLLTGLLCAFFARFELTKLFRGLPKIIIRTDGIEYQTVRGVYWANWASLAPFEIIRIQSARTHYRVMRAQIIGTNVDQNLARNNYFFEMANECRSDAAEIVVRANAARNDYLSKHPAEKISL